MWVEFEILEKKHYLLWTLNDENDVDCVLYNGHDSWHEKQSLNIILKRAKELNKRIQFDEATIKETLQNAQPNEANWLDGDGDGDSKECSLKLKYRVKQFPLNFTWHFTKQTEHDQFILFPLFRIVHGLTQQNDELREVVRKKDLEIKQYKIEGATLRRATVATTPFRFGSFDEKYAESIALTKTIMQISDLLKAQYKPMQMPITTNDIAPDDSSKNGNAKLTPRKKRRKSVDLLTAHYKAMQMPIRTNDTARDDSSKDGNAKLTPRGKRRKILDEQQRIMAEKLKARGKPMEYESSQSEQITTSSPEVSDVEISKNESTLLEKISNVKAYSEVKAQSNDKKSLTPSKSLRGRKEPIQSTTLDGGKLRKRKPTAYIEYDNSQSSSEESEEEAVTPKKTDEKKSSTSTTNLHSPLNTTSQHSSDDIQSILDEWKALEQRRVADLNNSRTTRNGKRLCF